MPPSPNDQKLSASVGLDLKDEDILEAMKKVPGYLDITPQDFKEVYCLAYQQALKRLRRGVAAGAIMTREVVFVHPDAPLAEVAAAMGRRGVSGVPVVDEAHQVVGVISEKDFLTAMGVPDPRNFLSLVASCLNNKGCAALPIKQERARDLMSSPPVTVGMDTPVSEIAEILRARRINRVPVTDAAGRLQGMVSRADVIKAMRPEAPA